VLDRGKREGVFNGAVDPVDVHLLISSFYFFRVSNRHTFGALFDCDLSAPALREQHRRLLRDAVMNAVMARSATESRKLPDRPGSLATRIVGAR
jgi:hypothetical protein